MGRSSWETPRRSRSSSRGSRSSSGGSGEFAGRTVASILGQEETGRERQREGPLRVLDVETAEYEGQAVRENGSIIDLTLLRRGR